MLDERNYYQDGYETGIDWTADYRPGGPYRCTDDRRCPDAVKRDKANSKEWFRGFDDGVAAQNKGAK